MLQPQSQGPTCDKKGPVPSSPPPHSLLSDAYLWDCFPPQGRAEVAAAPGPGQTCSVMLDLPLPVPEARSCHPLPLVPDLPPRTP